jgi:hypothetical protein
MRTFTNATEEAEVDLSATVVSVSLAMLVL